MVYVGMGGNDMMVNAVFIKATEMLVAEQGKDLKEFAHEVLQLSNADVSLREFKRITQPDYKGRQRRLSFNEAYKIAEHLGKTVDEIIKLGLRL